MDILIMVGQLILALSIMIGLHEFGHLITAKMFGMRVEQFSIGFFPKVFGIKLGDTEYAIGAIPLGGFVKISGMIDESLDKEQLKQPPKPWEFRSKPAWQRLIVMLGGIIMNVITAIVVFILITFTQGESYVPSEVVKQTGIVAHPLAQQVGLKTGDVIVSVNGKPYHKFSDLVSADVLLNSGSYYTVARGTDTFKVDLPEDLIEKTSDQKDPQQFISFPFKFSVSEISLGSNAAEAGLEKGDTIVSINGNPIVFFHQFKALADSLAGKQVALTVRRPSGNKTLEAKFTDDGKLGFMPQPIINEETETYTLGQSIPKGTVKAFTIVGVQIKAFRKMFSGEISARKSLSGPIGIAQQFGTTWNWLRFWTWIGVLSMVLAFMNLLPIPALDGGHVVFTLYEIVTRRKPGDTFMEYAQKAGMALLLALMAFIIINDIVKLF